MSQPQATKIAEVFNGLISLLIESDPKWSLEKPRLASLLNLGTQVNGSWRNEIGVEGGYRVKELLVTHYAETGEMTEATVTDGSRLDPTTILSNYS